MTPTDRVGLWTLARTLVVCGAWVWALWYSLAWASPRVDGWIAEIQMDCYVGPSAPVPHGAGKVK